MLKNIASTLCIVFFVMHHVGVHAMQRYVRDLQTNPNFNDLRNAVAVVKTPNDSYDQDKVRGHVLDQLYGPESNAEQYVIPKRENLKDAQVEVHEIRVMVTDPVLINQQLNLLQRVVPSEAPANSDLDSDVDFVSGSQRVDNHYGRPQAIYSQVTGVVVAWQYAVTLTCANTRRQPQRLFHVMTQKQFKELTNSNS